MLYQYRAIDAAGQLRRGRQEASNAADLELRLKSRELDLIEAQPAGEAAGFGRGSLPRRELIDFCYHLEQLLRAGLPLLEGLADLAESLEHRRLREATLDLREQIAGGASLSQAMAGQINCFDPLFVSLVQAGESCGRLPEILASLGESLKWQDELAAQTRRLLLYPAFVATAVLGATVFLMLYLVPQLKLFALNLGQSLPWHTRLLFGLSDAIVAHWLLLLALPLALIMLVALTLRLNPLARLHFDALKLRLPVTGQILRKIILARFASTFALLYGAGIPVLEAIASTRRVIGNRLLRRALADAEQAIRDGQQLASAFRDSGVFPSLVVRMLHLGERTGGLDRALLNISDFYNRDVREAIERAQAMIEPLLTLCLGSLLAWVMLAMLGPIYDLVSQLK